MITGFPRPIWLKRSVKAWRGRAHWIITAPAVPMVALLAARKLATFRSISLFSAMKRFRGLPVSFLPEGILTHRVQTASVLDLIVKMRTGG